MEFRLLYEGQLGANRRPKEKHAIRRSFHPQLRHLWKIKNNLRQLAEHRSTSYLVSKQDPRPTTKEERIGIGIRAIGEHWSRAGFQLVPLVTRKHDVRCSLDILLLRPDEDRFILNSGDIDGRLKMLFDALRIPDNESETGALLRERMRHRYFAFWKTTD